MLEEAPHRQGMGRRQGRILSAAHLTAEIPLDEFPIVVGRIDAPRCMRDLAHFDLAASLQKSQLFQFLQLFQRTVGQVLEV